jgi:hypothetical protein
VYRHAPALTILVAATITPAGWGNLWGLCAGTRVTAKCCAVKK